MNDTSIGSRRATAMPRIPSRPSGTVATSPGERVIGAQPSSNRRHNRMCEVVGLLDADADFASGVGEHELPLVRRRAVARAIELDRRGWGPLEIPGAGDAGSLGLLVLDGLMIRRITIGKRPACELFGPGDVIPTRDALPGCGPLAISVDWLALEKVRLANLDAAFARRIASWPSITSQLLDRVAERARHLSLAHAASRQPHIGARLMITFWLLAERWGRVGLDGVRVTLPVTHELLAVIVGSRRPTVSLALQRLSAAELLIRESSDRWLLSNEAIERLAHPEAVDLTWHLTTAAVR